jgi:hypothetical protein
MYASHLAELLFTDNPVFREIYAQRKCSELVIPDWSGDAKPERKLTYVLALNYSIGPKSAKAFDTQV